MGRIFSCVIAFAFGVSGVRAQVFGFAAEGVSSGKASENVVVADGFWKNQFYRDIESKRNAYTQQSAARHNWPRFITNTVASVGMAYIGKTALKAIINEERPDHSDNKSFPSGHASMAFAAARSLDKEFRKENIWIPIAGYTAATAIGVERVVSDRHHWYDVVAGAALGFGASELIWWLSDELLGKGSDVVVGSSGSAVDLKYSF